MATAVLSEDYQFLAHPDSLTAGDRHEPTRKNDAKDTKGSDEEKLDYDYGRDLYAIYEDYGYVTHGSSYGSKFEGYARDVDGFSCWACARNYWDKDSTGDLYADCRNFGEAVKCSDHIEDGGSSHYTAPVSCQVTERRFFGIVTELHVGCKQTQACHNNFIQNRMQGSVYGRSCRPDRALGISTCRQCCSTDDCYSDANLIAENFDEESEWFDESAHATYVVV